MKKILVSACLLGECVKYSGGHNRCDHPKLAQWQAEGRLVPVCPEVMAGLETPRAPAEIDPETGRVMTCEGEDVSAPFSKGAAMALDVALEHGVKLALLKQNSPSCGSSQIYDGTFQGRRVPGQGVTAALLEKNGIRVISEDDDLDKF